MTTPPADPSAAAAQEALARLSEFLGAGNLEGARSFVAELSEGWNDSASDSVLQELHGRIALHQGAWEEAYRRFEAAHELRPSLETAVVLAECAFRTDRFDRALACYRAWCAASPEDPNGFLGLANALQRLEWLDEAREAIETAERLDSENGRILARLGCIELGFRHFDRAENAFGRAAALDPSLALCGMVSFRRELLDALEKMPDVSTPPIAVQVGAADRCSTVATVSCDAGYYEKYGAMFLRSFAQNAERSVLLHLHLFDPDAALLDRVKIDLPRYSLKHFTVSSSRLNVMSRGESNESYARRVFYSCGRFVFLPAWLEAYRKPIVMLDIDTVVEGGLERYVEVVGDADVGLYKRGTPDAPWLDVIANFVVITPSLDAIGFFRLVRNYILHFFSVANAHWHLDQIALYCCLEMMRQHRMPPDVVWFTADMLAKAVLQIGHAYDYKLADPRVARYRAADARDSLGPMSHKHSRAGAVWRRLFGRGR